MQAVSAMIGASVALIWEHHRRKRMRKRWTIAVLGVALAGAVLLHGNPADTAMQKPRYTADGKLLRPADYREWVFLSSGLGMNYGPSAAGASAPPAFTNVFVQPEAYRAFQQSGRWPEGTILMLEIYNSVTHGSIN